MKTSACVLKMGVVGLVCGLLGCSNESAGEGARPALLVTTADFANGTAGFGVLWTDGTVTMDETPSPDIDSIPFVQGGQSFLLQRNLNNVNLLDAENPLEIAASWSANAVGETGNANPQAIVSLSDDQTQMGVVRLYKNSLLKLDIPNKALLGEIDLSALLADGDTDGSVDASSAIRVNDRVFVALGRYFIDSMYTTVFPGASVLAVYDLSGNLIDTDEAAPGVQGVTLASRNPQFSMGYDDVTGRIFVVTHGDYRMLDGGIEAIDLTNLQSMGSIVTEMDLGGEIQDFKYVDRTHAFIVVGDYQNGKVVEWNPYTGAIGRTWVDASASSIAVGHNTLYVAINQAGGNGIKTFDLTTGDETTQTSPASIESRVIPFGTLPIYGMAALQ